MQEWPHWGEIARGAQKEGMTEEAFSQALPEFQRFMALVSGYPGLGMLSEQVDQVWHALILNTVRYREFCQEFIGRFVDHLPCSSYELYGISETSICKTPPSSCTDPYPAPPDPSPVPKRQEALRYAIENGSLRFLEAYRETFEVEPDAAIWQRATLVDGIAL